MPKKKQNPYDEWLVQGWKTFGRWLRVRRCAAQLTVQQAADAVKVSKRQWIRYENGARVPYKRLERIAEKLNIERQRIYSLAGHEVPRKRNDAPALLRHMHVTLRSGDLTSALRQFFDLYQTLRPEKDKSDREIDGALTDEFAKAVTFLDMLPTWLFEIVLDSMQYRLEKQRKDDGVYVRFRNSLLKDCLAQLRMETPGIVDTCPDIAVGGTIRMGVSAASFHRSMSQSFN
ncbi:MAG TPA: helix-turn-helix transcriptional regulator [Pyrinomonadaceae bacterium]|nr:helix-turn-helix transcriptional regulator [Pyrinomonadaceae bacterium]